MCQICDMMVLAVNQKKLCKAVDLEIYTNCTPSLAHSYVWHLALAMPLCMQMGLRELFTILDYLRFWCFVSNCHSEGALVLSSPGRKTVAPSFRSPFTSPSHFFLDFHLFCM
jgi:hypothetical protein